MDAMNSVEEDEGDIMTEMIPTEEATMTEMIPTEEDTMAEMILTEEEEEMVLIVLMDPGNLPIGVGANILPINSQSLFPPLAVLLIGVLYMHQEHK